MSDLTSFAGCHVARTYLSRLQGILTALPSSLQSVSLSRNHLQVLLGPGLDGPEQQRV